MSNYYEEDEVDYSDGSLSEASIAHSDTALGAEAGGAQIRSNTDEVRDESSQLSRGDPLSSSYFSDSSDEEEDGERYEEQNEYQNGKHDEEDDEKDFFENYDEQNFGVHHQSQDNGLELEATAGSDEIPFSPKTWARLEVEHEHGHDYKLRPRSKYCGVNDGLDGQIELWLQPRSPDHPLHYRYEPASRGRPGPERQRRIGEDTLPELPNLPIRWSRLGQDDPNSKKRVEIVGALLAKQASKTKSYSESPSDETDEEDNYEDSSPLSLERPSSIPHIREEDPTSPGSPITDAKDCFEGPSDSDGNPTVIPWEKAVELTTEPRNWADENDEDEWLGCSSSEHLDASLNGVRELKAASAGRLESPVGPDFDVADHTCLERLRRNSADDIDDAVDLAHNAADHGDAEDIQEQESSLEYIDSPIVLRPNVGAEGFLKDLRRNQQGGITDAEAAQGRLVVARVEIVEELKSKVRAGKRFCDELQQNYGRLQQDYARLHEDFSAERYEHDQEFFSNKQRYDEELRLAFEHMQAQQEIMESRQEEIDALEARLEEEQVKTRQEEQKFWRWKKYAEDIEPLAEAERTRRENECNDGTNQIESGIGATTVAKCTSVECSDCEAVKDERDTFADEAEYLRSEVSRLQEDLQEDLQEAAQLGLHLAQQARQLENKPVLRNVFQGLSDSPEPTPASPPTPTVLVHTSSTESDRPAWQVRMDKWRKSPEFIAKCNALEVKKKAQKHQRWQERENARLDRKLKMDVYALIANKHFEYMPLRERNLLLGRMQSELSAAKEVKVLGVRA